MYVKALQVVLQGLESTGLLLNKDKCLFQWRCLLPYESHIQVIFNVPTPSDASTLGSLFGLMSWYCKIQMDSAGQKRLKKL